MNQPSPNQSKGTVPEEAVEAATKAFERLPNDTQFRERLTQLPEYGESVVPPRDLARAMLEAGAPFLAQPLSERLKEVERQRDKAVEARREIESKLESGYSFCHPEDDCEGKGNSGGVEEGWHEVWVWRDEITGKLHSTTGSTELTPIPPVDGIRPAARLYAAASTQPPSPQAEVQDCERAKEIDRAEAVERYLDEAREPSTPHPLEEQDTGKQPPAEPQGEVVEILAKRRHEREHAAGFDDRPWDALPGFTQENQRQAAREDIAALTPLLALDVRERLEGKAMKALQHLDGLNTNESLARKELRDAALAALDTPAPSEEENGG